MYVVLLRFSTAIHLKNELSSAHGAWLGQGFADGVFLLAGGLPPQLGGAILASGLGREALEARLRLDPYVEHDVVRAEIVEIAPMKTEPRLAFLLETSS